MAAGDDAALKARIDGLVAPYVAARDFMGVVGVGRQGQEPLLLPYGLASVELEVLHGPDGIFMVGSVSKQFTAAAVLLLEEDGLLHTADAVGAHMADFGHGQVTVEQLLTHTGGVADIYSLERFGQSAGYSGTQDEVTADLGAAALTHEPGTAYVYSNGGYAVLAALVERVSGMPYGEFLQRRLFGPLGMAATAHGSDGPAVAGRVPGYDPWGRQGLAPTAPLADAYTLGAGSIWSSAADLLVWAAALHGGRVLQAESYAKMCRDYGYGYGYGVSVFTRFGRLAVGHDGRVAGFSSDLAHYTQDGLSVAVLSNVQSVARDEIRRLVAAAALGVEQAPPAPRPPFVPAAELDGLTGGYSFGPGFDVSLHARDGRLLARANLGGYSELLPLGGDVWFSRMLYTAVRFGRDASGTVDRLIWGLGEGAPAGRRK